MRRRCLRVALSAIVACALCSGCGDSGPFKYVPVHGKVTFEDGTVIPAGGILLQFAPIDAKPVGDARPKIAAAQVDAQGEFACATSHKYGDGLIPGKHKVSLSYATDASGKLLIPKDYASITTTPLVIETTGGNIEIKVPKP